RGDPAGRVRVLLDQPLRVLQRAGLGALARATGPAARLPLPRPAAALPAVAEAPARRARAALDPEDPLPPDAHGRAAPYLPYRARGVYAPRSGAVRAVLREPDPDAARRV